MRVCHSSLTSKYKSRYLNDSTLGRVNIPFTWTFSWWLQCLVRQKWSAIDLVVDNCSPFCRDQLNSLFIICWRISSPKVISLHSTKITRSSANKEAWTDGWIYWAIEFFATLKIVELSTEPWGASLRVFSILLGGFIIFNVFLLLLLYVFHSSRKNYKWNYKCDSKTKCKYIKNTSIIINA